MAKPVEDQSWVEEVWILEPTLASSSTRSSPQKFGKSPRGKFWLTPRRRVGFSLEVVLETLPVQTRGEETSSKPIQAKELPVGVRAEPKSRSG